MARPLEDVYCTLLMSDSYLPGAAVLAHSLRDAGTKKKLAVLITLDTLAADTISQLKTLYDYLIPVERIRTPSPANLYLMGRPDLSFAFTKIALWRQTQFRKIVYLDADVVALRALDELFDIEASFAAAPDIGWPDAFNSGVMVLSPDMGEYWALQTMAATGDSFDGADQGLLNQYFEHRPWQRLKFTYNCTPNAEYQWEPAYRHYKRDISAVHFIGKEKPWSKARSNAPGVYGELLGRWWQVHDRHLRREDSDTTQNHEVQVGREGTEHFQNSAPTPNIVVEPEAPTTTTEAPMTDSGEGAESTEQGLTEPTSTAEQRKFSAPEMEWDATRFEPPAQSKPEAANFPTAQYTFSESRNLFKAPRVYPEPPKDMWYKVPDERPKPAERPKPIFPWEQQANRPQPTRVFAEDLPPEPTSAFGAPSPTHPFSTVHYDEAEETTSSGSARDSASPEPLASPPSANWQSFQQNSANAWDSVPGIDNYVRAIMEQQGRRTQTQILKQVTGTDEISSPQLERKLRRESLILTDFPSAVERPSLPVTPAPIRRPTFWGEERNQAGELPAAEGVPDQTEWNPDAKLEQLRRTSLVEFEHLTKDPHPDPPLRALPEHSVLEDDSASTPQASSSGAALSHGLNQVRSFDGVSESSSKQVNYSYADQSMPGIATADFAHSAGTVEGSKSSGSEGLFFTSQGLSNVSSSDSRSNDGEGLFFTSQGLSNISSSASQQQSSSSYSSSTSHQQSSSSHSSTQQSSSSGGTQIQSGKMTFTLPDFGREGSVEAAAAQDDVLSPTQPKDE